jgi:uncharacterized protein YgiM (DUF1202 family)
MRILFLIFILSTVSSSVLAQLKLGTAKSQINFREGPGINYKIVHTIDNSNLLVILPREPKNNFIEVFDIESSTYGFIAENLVTVIDSLNFQEQHFFERSGENETGLVEIEMVNLTSESLYIWINKSSYVLSPHEKKVLMLISEDVTFFSSAPGLFPVFGKEILKKGSTYRWNFSL